jgi:predicted transcriptional regulator
MLRPDDAEGCTIICADGTNSCAPEGDRGVIRPEDIYDKVWQFLVRKLQEKADQPGMNKRKVAEMIGIPAPTVYRWINGERGQDVKLLSVITIIHRLGVSMDELIAGVAPGQAATIFRILQEHPALFQLIMDILDRGGDEDLAQLEMHMKYIKKKIEE